MQVHVLPDKEQPSPSPSLRQYQKNHSDNFQASHQIHQRTSRQQDQLLQIIQLGLLQTVKQV